MSKQMAKKAIWKKPEEWCKCIHWMEEEGLIRFTQAITKDGKDIPAPIIDHPKKRKNAPFVFINYCPYCGKPTFDVVENEAQP